MGLNFCAFANVFKGIIKMNTKNGIFLTQDIFKKPIVLEWEEIEGKTEMLDEKIKSISSLFISTYVKQEVDFFSKNIKVFTSEEIENDFMIRALAPYLGQSQNKFNLEEKIKNTLEEFFGSINWSQYSTSDDINIFVIARDGKTQEKLGAIQFLIRPEFEQNNIKVGLFGISNSAQDKGLKKLIMSSIFKLRPDVKRIFLHTRSTNTDAILDYKNWGFTEFIGKLSNWTDLEYLIENSNSLQKTSEDLVAQR